MILRVPIALLLAVSASPVFGTAIVDRISDSSSWTDKKTLFHISSDTAKGNGPAAFIGNGDEISKIGLLFGVSLNGTKNAGDVDALGWRFMFFAGLADFSSDSFGDARPAGWHYQFDDPANASWRDVVGTSNGYDLRYVEFDVRFLHLQTTAGVLELASVLPVAPALSGIGTVLAESTGGIGSEPDWYRNTEIGPGTYQSLGFSYPFGAWRIETASVTPFPGDANGDRVVDFTDLGILLNNYNQPGLFASGDFDNSGTVDFTDLGILLNNYNQHAPVVAASLPVPEPSSLLLAALGALGLLLVACLKQPPIKYKKAP